MASACESIGLNKEVQLFTRWTFDGREVAHGEPGLALVVNVRSPCRHATWPVAKAPVEWHNEVQLEKTSVLRVPCRLCHHREVPSGGANPKSNSGSCLSTSCAALSWRSQ
eukprot:s7859_g3.t1